MYRTDLDGGGSAGVDYLVSYFRTAGWARNHVELSDREAVVAGPQLTFAFEDEEHLFLAMVAVECTLNLAGREHRQVVAKLLGSNAIADLATP